MYFHNQLSRYTASDLQFQLSTSKNALKENDNTTT